MKKNATIWFVLAVFIVPFTAYGIYNYFRATQPLPVFGNEPGSKQDHRVGEFNLADQQGKSSTLDQWKGKIVVADFFFTHCPTICPKMTDNLSKIQSTFLENDDIMIRSFTVDPERDSVGRMKIFAEERNINYNKWQLLTGDKKQLYKLARNSFKIVATDGDGGPGDFIHSENLVLVDRKQRIRGYYDGTSEKETEQLIKDIKKLYDEN